MINVFFPYYNCGDATRQAEIDLCLKKNIENQLITRLIILIDDETTLEITDPRVTVKYLTQRPTYRLWIELTKELQLAGVSALINSDIYFDETLSIVSQVIDAENKFLALSRWELNNTQLNLHKNPHWSQDVWAFHSDSVFSKEMLLSLDFPMGVPRCDNKIAYIFATRGFGIYNPCQFLRSIHVHETEMRTYHKKLDERILGGVAYVYPGENATDEATLDFDIWIKRSTAIKKVALNKSLEKWLAEAEKSDSSVAVVPKVAVVQHTVAPANASGVQVQRATALDVSEHGLEKADTAEFLTALKANNIVTQFGVHFKILTANESFYFSNIYQPTLTLKTSATHYGRNTPLCQVMALIPAVLGTFVNAIGIKPKDKDDINFWQYPCATEKQAYENHLTMALGSNVDQQQKVVNIYIPLPWATYIDKKQYPEAYLSSVAKLIGHYRDIANQNGYQLAVHTVCQHIHWVRILGKCTEIGITNLHISHKDSKSEAAQAAVGTTLTLHGWPLIAVNYEIPERSMGMERKPMAERKLLASFIGAHMKHYRDDSRIRLFEAAKASGRDDVLVDLGTEWHFNKIVYEEQVLNRAVSAVHLDEHEQKTLRYNQILSDSKFSLCPEGAGPNTLRFWESIAVGSIPVIFNNDLSILLENKVCKRLIDYLIVWRSEISNELFQYLSEFDISEIERRSRAIIEIYKEVGKLDIKGSNYV